MLAMGNSATLADRLLVPPSMQNGGGGRRGGWEGQTLSVPNQGGTYTNSYSSSHGHFGGGFPVQAPPSPYFQPMRGGWGGYGFPPSSPGPAPSIYSTPTNQHHHARHMDIYSSVGTLNIMAHPSGSVGTVQRVASAAPSGYSTPSGTIQVPNPNHGRTLSSHPQPNEPFLKSREPSQPSRPKSPVASAVRPPSVRPLAERPPSRNINTPYAVAAPQRPRESSHFSSDRLPPNILEDELFSSQPGRGKKAAPGMPSPRQPQHSPGQPQQTQQTQQQYGVTARKQHEVVQEIGYLC
eukprot:Tamp_15755.p1 GENE.Tamp_15755~~Tamp_15755.p1  ORF type:complete len:294 (+),score=23.37 Tamp_15755:102-983(+)